MPIALALLGVALLIVGLLLYPRRAENPAPLSTKLDVFSTCPLYSIGYGVDPVPGHPGVSRLTVQLSLPEGLLPGSGACRGGAGAGVTVTPPPGTTLLTGTTFLNCQACHGHWTVGLSFPPNGLVAAHFLVKASSFGVVSNGITTSAAIPEIVNDATGTPELLVAYHIPSAISYDWSADPPVSIRKSIVIWSEPVAQHQTAGRAAIGIDQAAQASDSFKIFLAGVLIALAGAAILAAIVEAVHTRDWDVIRALHPKEPPATAQRPALGKGSPGDLPDSAPR
ncbi:MAG TPA: hypothetical protein VIX86_03955 [Streptosporangiaceae bacterium]